MHPVFTPAQYNLLWRILSESPVESPEKDEIMQALADVREHSAECERLGHELDAFRLEQDKQGCTAELDRVGQDLQARIDAWADSLPGSVAHEGDRLRMLAMFVRGE